MLVCVIMKYLIHRETKYKSTSGRVYLNRSSREHRFIFKESHYSAVVMVILAATVFGQPTHQHQSTDSYYNWFNNPCGVIRLSDHSPPIIDVEDDTISTFLLQLMVTLNRIQHWINNFANRKFGSSFSEMEALDEEVHYAWLLVSSTVPNNKTDSMDIHYRELTLEEFIIKTNEIMQRFAIAWELVITEGDQQFQFEFKNIAVFHRLVLCELDSVLTSKNLLQKIQMLNNHFMANAIVPCVFRHFSRFNSERNVRNFRIIKDYIRALQYLIKEYKNFV